MVEGSVDGLTRTEFGICSSRRAALVSVAKDERVASDVFIVAWVERVVRLIMSLWWAMLDARERTGLLRHTT